MKRLLILVLAVSFLGILSAAGQSVPEEGAPAGMRQLSSQRAASGVTRAVVIGISDYAAPGIRDLQFAHKDARAFADFLKSEAGGAFPAGNIRLLLNEQATLAAIYDAFYWLRTQSEKGDKAILYFAGHGDLETEAFWQFGYLLAHDSPPNNFRTNAVRVEDLDILAIELSSVREARTVFYIDACRSGTLAEGRQVPHTHLAKQRANEVRVLSCQPDQLSLEGSQWGGGRGAFSWHLIRGLQGLAMDPSISRDEPEVTVEELEEYLKATLVKDTRALDPDKRQDPVVAGPRTFSLARVVPDILAAAKAGFDLQAPEFAMLVSRSIREEDMDAGTPASPLTSLFAIMRAGDIWRQMDLAAFREIPREDLPGVLFRSIRAEAHAYDLEPPQASALQQAAGEAYASLVDSASRMQAAQHIALALHNAGQVLINRYLSADPKELAERSYHQYRHSRYRQDPELFRLALNLLPEDHPLQPRLAVKAAYFEGLSLRVQGFFDEQPEDRYRQALEAQLEALKQDDKAPYIHNELGILYNLTDQPALAEQHYRTAAALAPSWSLPIANLCGMLADQQRYDEAWQLAEKGQALDQPNYLLHYHIARLYEQAGNLLQAEDHYHQAISLDTAHFAAYARLGELYLNTSEYPMAEWALELALQKGMLAVTGPEEQAYFPPGMLVDGAGFSLEREHPQTFLDRIAMDPGDTEAHYKLAMIYWSMGKPRDAEEYFRKLAALDPLYPWLWDQFAWFLVQQNRYPEAWRAMEKAPELPEYRESQQALRGLILENMGRSVEAARLYQEMLALNPHLHALRPRLWKICEQRGQWVEAERQMLAFEAIYPSAAALYRLEYYRRMRQRFPEDREWLRRELEILAGHCHTRTPMTAVHEFPYRIKTTSAESYYQSALKPPALSLNVLGEDLTAACREAEAILLALLAGETLSEERATWLRRIALTRETLGDKVQARAYLEEVLALEPSDQATREMLARGYQAANRSALARDHFAELHKQGVLRYPDHYALARAYTHAWDFSPASWLLREAETQSLEAQVSFQNREMRSRAKLIAGEWAGAWPVYQEMQQAFPEFSDICYTLARLAMHQEQPDQAWQWLDRALAKGFAEIHVLAYDPLMAPLRGEDGWQDLMKKYGLNIPGRG